MFISFDGIDGVGKSTQIRLLSHWLTESGRPVVTCRDPGSTTLGEAIRGLLLGDRDPSPARTTEMLLYMAARAQLVAEIVQPALKEGSWVVSDRFLLSNVVYQGHAGGLPVAELWSIGRLACQGLLPTVSIVLDLPPEEALLRLQRPLDRMERAGLTFRQRLRDGFLAEAAAAPDRIQVVDARGTVEQVQLAIRQVLRPWLAT